MEQLMLLEQRIEDIKQHKMEAFDKLDLTEEQIQGDIDRLVDEGGFQRQAHIDNEIKEVEEDEEEAAEGEAWEMSMDGDRV